MLALYIHDMSSNDAYDTRLWTLVDVPKQPGWKNMTVSIDVREKPFYLYWSGRNYGKGEC